MFSKNDKAQARRRNAIQMTANGQYFDPRVMIEPWKKVEVSTAKRIVIFSALRKAMKEKVIYLESLTDSEKRKEEISKSEKEIENCEKMLAEYIEEMSYHNYQEQE